MPPITESRPVNTADKVYSLNRNQILSKLAEYTDTKKLTFVVVENQYVETEFRFDITAQFVLQSEMAKQRAIHLSGEPT